MVGEAASGSAGSGSGGAGSGAGGPVVVLVRPQMGENIGAAARAMRNFGLSEMRIVDPRDGWPNPRAVAMASGAGRILDEARVFPNVGAAVADLGFVFATTARSRELTKPVFAPEAAMVRAREMAAQGERVGILYGPERSGLENDDLIFANAILTVPVNPDFPSLNLAQCVLLTAYEWRLAGEAVAGEVLVSPGGRMALRGEVERFAGELCRRLEAAGFFWPEDKRPSMEANVKNLLGRLPLTEADVRTLWGIVRALSEARDER